MKKRIITALFIITAVIITCVSAYAEESTVELESMTDTAVTVNCQTEEEHSLYVALYKDGVLEKLVKSDKDTAELPLEGMEDAAYTMKAFCWSVGESMEPLAKPMESHVTAVSAENIIDSDTSVPSVTIYDKNEGGRKNISLADNFELYINGRRMTYSNKTEAGQLLDDLFAQTQYLAGETLFSDTNGDGECDALYATVCATAVVYETLVNEETGKVTVYFGEYSQNTGASRLATGDEDVEYSFTLNGQEISASDLQEGDILTIKYNITDAFKYSSYYDVVVTRETVSGRCTRLSSDGDRVTIDAQTYTISAGMYLEFSLGADYTVYLDAYGKVAYAVEMEREKNIAILTNIYKRNGGDWFARIITSQGVEKEYPVDDADVLTYGNSYFNVVWTEENGVSYSESGEYSRLGSYPKQVIDYRIDENTGNLIIKGKLSNTDVHDMSYKASAQKCGKLMLSDTTKILDISDTENGGALRTMTVNDLIDEVSYSMSGYEISSVSGKAGFVIITEKSAQYGLGIIEGVTDGTVSVYTSGDILELNTDNYYNEEIADTIAAFMTRTTKERVVKFLYGDGNIYDAETVEPKTTATGAYDGTTVGEYGIEEDNLTYIANDGSVTDIRKKFLTKGNEYTVCRYESGYDALTVVYGGELSDVSPYDTGILVCVYKLSGGDMYARIITTDGAEHEYKVSDNSAIKEEYYPEQPKTVHYILTVSGIEIAEETAPALSVEFGSYNKTEGKIGTIPVSEDTVILDLTGYAEDIRLLTTEDLADGGEYVAAAYDASQDGTSYELIVISGGDRYDIGIVSAVSEGTATITKDGEETELEIEEGYYETIGVNKTLASELTALMKKPVKERVVRYLHREDVLYALEDLQPSEHSGGFVDGYIGDYKINTTYVNFCNENGEVSYENTRRFKDSEDFSVNVYKKGCLTFELVSGDSDAVDTTARGRLGLDEEYGWFMNSYTDNSGNYIVRFMTEKGEAKEFELATSVKFRAPNQIESAQQYTSSQLGVLISQILAQDSFPHMWKSQRATSGAAPNGDRPYSWTISNSIRLAKYKLDNDGRISMLYFAANIGNYDQNYYDASSRYVANNKNITDPYVDSSTINALLNSDALVVNITNMAGSTVVGGLVGGYSIKGQIPEFHIPSDETKYNKPSAYTIKTADTKEYNASANPVTDDYIIGNADGINPGVIIRFQGNAAEIVNPGDLDNVADIPAMVVDTIDTAIDDEDNIVYTINGYNRDGIVNVTTTPISALAELTGYMGGQYVTGNVLWDADSNSKLSDYLHRGDIIITDGNHILLFKSAEEMQSNIINGNNADKTILYSDTRNIFRFGRVTGYGISNGTAWFNLNGFVVSCDKTLPIRVVEIDGTDFGVAASVKTKTISVTDLKPYSEDANEYDYAYLRTWGSGKIGEIIVYRIKARTDGSDENPAPFITNGVRKAADENYGWIMDGYDDNGEYTVKIMTESGKAENFKIADSVKYWAPAETDVTKGGTAVTKETAASSIGEVLENDLFTHTWNVLRMTTGSATHFDRPRKCEKGMPIRLVKYSANADNELTKLYFAVNVSNLSEYLYEENYNSTDRDVADESYITDKFITSDVRAALENSDALIFDMNNKAGTPLSCGTVGGYVISDGITEFGVPEDMTKYEKAAAYIVKPVDSAEYNVSAGGVSDTYFVADANGIDAGTIVRCVADPTMPVDPTSIDTAANIPAVIVESVEQTTDDNGNMIYTINGLREGAKVRINTSPISALGMMSSFNSGTKKYNMDDRGVIWTADSEDTLANYLHKGDILITPDGQSMLLYESAQGIYAALKSGDTSYNKIIKSTDTRNNFWLDRLEDMEEGSWIEVGATKFVVDSSKIIQVTVMDMSAENADAAVTVDEICSVSDLIPYGTDENQYDYTFVRTANKGAIQEVYVYRIVN